MTRPTSRFEEVTRRAFVKRSLVIGALVATPGLACSTDDKQTFKSTASTASTTATTIGAGSTTSAGASSVPASSVASGASGASGASSTIGVAAASGPAFPTGGKVVVNFTFAATDGGGRVNNPFIAVWIENASGELVKTVSLWFKDRESKYLNNLTRWATVETAFAAAGKTDPYDTVSGATRLAGAYSVAWDGTDASGAAVVQGQYFVCIEAAREHGPYELIRGPIAIGSTALTAPLADNGELTTASAQLVV